MALAFGDRVQETFTTTGTGTISLLGASTGYQAFSAIVANAGTCYYGASDGGSNWEIGIGTYTTSGDTLARTLILASSNSGSAVNWAAGTKTIWLDSPAALIASAAGTEVPQGRLTLSSNTPVMTSSVTAVSPVYYTPYVGNQIPIYNGQTFLNQVFSQLTMTLNATNNLSGKIYDLFVFLNSGVVTIASSPAWTNSTTRSAALTQLNGIWVNNATITLTNGSTTYSNVAANQATYVGSVYCTANAQTGMNFAPAAAAGGGNPILGVWNAYNRTKMSALSLDSTASWSYGTATWRCTDAGATGSGLNNRISYIDGLGQSFVSTKITGGGTSSGVNLDEGVIGINLNSTTAAPVNGAASLGVTSASFVHATACNEFLPTMGFNYLQGMEYGGGSTLTWYGQSNSQQGQAISANIEM